MITNTNGTDAPHTLAVIFICFQLLFPFKLILMYSMFSMLKCKAHSKIQSNQSRIPAFNHFVKLWYVWFCLQISQQNGILSHIICLCVHQFILIYKLKNKSHYFPFSLFECTQTMYIKHARELFLTRSIIFFIWIHF